MIESIKKHHRDKLSDDYLSVLDEKYEEYCKKRLSLSWLAEATNINLDLLRSIMDENDLEIKNHPIRISAQENKLYHKVKSFYDGEVIQSDRKQLEGKEIDIWIPEKKLGIEYHGIVWHSNDPTRHLEKFNLAKKNGITLLQIFSSEWEQKPDVVTSIIKSKMGIFDKRIYARQTIVKELTNIEYTNFTNCVIVTGKQIGRAHV